MSCMRSPALQLKTSVSVSVVFQNNEMKMKIAIDLVIKMKSKRTSLIIETFGKVRTNERICVQKITAAIS